MHHLSQPTPFALLEKRAFGQWIQNKVDGAWNGVRDNVVNPIKQTAQGVADNARNAWHDVKQVGTGIGNVAGGGLEQAWDIASAPIRTGIGAVQGGMDGFKRTGTLGGTLGGFADGGLNTAKDMGNQIVGNAARVAGGYKDIAQGGVNGVSNAVKSTIGTQKLLGQAILAQPMAAYHGIAGAINAPGASPAPSTAAPGMPGSIQQGPPATAANPGTPGAIQQGPPAPVPPKAIPVQDPNPQFAQQYRDMPLDERMHARGAVNPPAPAPSAGPSPEQLAQFRKAHGSAYDPNSRMDRGKLQAMTQMGMGGPMLAKSGTAFATLG